ncbi:hypothetical protein NW768_011459 [Fusarium equiseti]|uniref:NB-ARC domain-containing protein n=1 Tax=Fusarium equiseti TaxID=61235 RepID=A0ABQ8QXX2_FUSEQ|nr:hypothetical protein NW768_011459 [Fusarium equiseti]
MFAYYEQARVCYTLLDDVTIEPALPEGSLPRGFTQSLWFTRGWTLQELIAPKLVRFFDSKWSFIGSKTDDFMLPTLVSVTNIDEIVLRVPSSTRVISISKKMSWAAKRKTTRKEDVAYCLMGIFGVFMSPLYGEGAHAFIRLQEAIMKVSNDHTIFAWTSPPTETLIHGLESVTTMLALSPSQFKDSANFQSLPHNKHNNTLQERYRLDYTSTNAGLSIRLPLLMIDEPNCLFVAFLACSDETPPVQTAILLKTSEGAPAGHFWRTSCNFGPTERHNARWLTCTGREEVTTQDIYVLPRFAPLSEVTIEPAWKQTTVTISSSEGAADKSLKLISDLHHDGEPAITQLSHLARTRYLISTGQSKEIVKQINAMRLISESLPGPRNRQYCRRLDEPQELIDKLITRKDRTQDCSPGPRICMISGMGGMGKTQMALDFCYHCLDIHMFDMIFWIPSETRHGALAAFHKLALKLELIEDVSPADLQTSKALEIVKAWMSSSGPKESAYGFDQRETRSKWLLVFDNVEDGEMIQEFMPSLGDGCILMTSRDASLGQSFQAEHIKLQPLTTTQSSHLLYKLTGLPGDLTEISKILHGYPLALAQIAKFISSRTLSLDEAIELFKVERPYAPGGVSKHKDQIL